MGMMRKNVRSLRQGVCSSVASVAMHEIDGEFLLTVSGIQVALAFSRRNSKERDAPPNPVGLSKITAVPSQCLGDKKEKSTLL